MASAAEARILEALAAARAGLCPSVHLKSLPPPMPDLPNGGIKEIRQQRVATKTATRRLLRQRQPDLTLALAALSEDAVLFRGGEHYSFLLPSKTSIWGTPPQIKEIGSRGAIR